MAPLPSVMDDVGYGMAQLKLAVLGGGVWAADGAELLLLGAVTTSVMHEWNLSVFDRGLMVSIVFFGVLVGNLCSGWIGDHHGRRLPIVLSYAGVSLFSIISVAACNLASLAFFRFFVGFSFGIGQPAWNTFASETVPDKFRAFQITLGQGLFSLGEMYSAGLIFINDPDMKDLDWRWLIAMGSVPSAVLLIFSFFLLPESPFFLALNGKMDEAQKVLKSFARSNGKPDVDTEFQVVPSPSPSRRSRYNFAEVFSPKLLFSTVVMSYSTFNLNFIFYGGLYAFPQVLPDLDMPVYPATNLLLGAASEIPGIIIGMFLGIYMRRKNNMMLFCICMVVSISSFLYGVNGERNMIFIQIGFITSKMMVLIGFAVFYIYCTEIYPTSCRTTGSSVCVSSGRVGALVCPLIYESLTYWTGSFTVFFYFMGALSAVNGVLIFFLPYETWGKHLPEDLSSLSHLLAEDGQPAEDEEMINN